MDAAHAAGGTAAPAELAGGSFWVFSVKHQLVRHFGPAALAPGELHNDTGAGDGDGAGAGGTMLQSLVHESASALDTAATAGAGVELSLIHI